jgi:cation transport ATPase
MCWPAIHFSIGSAASSSAGLSWPSRRRLFCGQVWPFFERGWSSIHNRSLKMFTRVALGAGSAYVYSVIVVLAPKAFPSSFHEMSGLPGLYFEAAAVITVLVLLGQVLELRARGEAGGAIGALLGLVQRLRAASLKMERKPILRSRTSRSATAFGSGRARRSPPTVLSSKGAARWTSRW